MAGRGGPTVIFMNRNGGRYQGAWWDDSRANESSVLGDYMVDLPAYPYGDRSWNSVMDCVRDLYADFSVEVTDIDPVNEPHLEVVVSGHPNNIGQPTGVAGIAPMACERIDNAVVYAFAEMVGDDPQMICETAGQESAHAFGLDHERLCEDVMTYLYCSAKSFVDEDAACGEYEERTCACGGETQNSYRYLLEVLGPAREANTPPRVAIVRPEEGEEVAPGFAVEVDAADDGAVERVELYLDGDLADADDEAPWRLRAPDDLGDGELRVEVLAVDDAGASASDDVGVLVRHDAEPDPEDPDDPAPDSPDGLGRLGEDCDDSSGCASNACVTDDGYCTERCDDDECDDGFECRETSVGSFCLLPEDDRGGDRGGCSTTGRPSPATALLGLLAFCGLFAPRPRKKRLR